MNYLDLLIAGLLAFWSLLALHYLPWDRLLGRRLPPPWTYVAGTLAWTSVYAGWLALRGAWAELAAMAVVVVCAGAAVAGAYALDGLLDLVHERRALRGDMADAEEMLRQAIPYVRGWWPGQEGDHAARNN